MKMAVHSVRVPGYPSPRSGSVALTIAFRLIRRYGSSVPTIEQLIRDFEVDRATAYRWRAAFIADKESQG